MKLLKFHSVFVLFVLLWGNAPAQEIDSLKKQLETAGEVENRALLYIKLSSAFQQINLDSSIYYLNQARILHKEFQLEQLEGNIKATYGDILVMQDSLNKALEEYSAVIPIISENKDFRMLAKVYLVIGNIYFMWDNYAKSQVSYINGLSISEQNDFLLLTPHFYNNIGSIYQAIESNKKAHEYFSKAATLFSKNGDTLNLNIAYINLANIYINTKQFPRAKEYLQEAEGHYLKTNNTGRLAEVYLSYALLSINEKKFEEALYFTSLSENEMNKDRKRYRGPLVSFLSQSLLYKGQAYFALDSLSMAQKHLSKCAELSIQNDLFTNASQAAIALSKLFEKKENTRQSLFYYKQYIQYSEKANDKEKLKKLAQSELEYAIEKQKKVQEIQMLEARNREIRTYWVFITGIISFTFLSVLLFLLLRLEKAKKSRAVEEKKNIQKDLDYRNKEMAAAVLFQMKKNELVLETSKKLKKLKLENQANARIVNDIISTLDKDSTTDLGEEFDIRFKDVHTGFYKSLAKQFPNLSTNELRLCAFLRLNMNSKDISSITYQSVNSITVARHRLRQKFNLEKEERLAGFLSQF